MKITETHLEDQKSSYRVYVLIRDSRYINTIKKTEQNTPPPPHFLKTHLATFRPI